MVGAITVKDVHKTFKNEDPQIEDVVALNGLSLDVEPGTFISLDRRAHV